MIPVTLAPDAPIEHARESMQVHRISRHPDRGRGGEQRPDGSPPVPIVERPSPESRRHPHQPRPASFVTPTTTSRSPTVMTRDGLVTGTARARRSRTRAKILQDARRSRNCSSSTTTCQPAGPDHDASDINKLMELPRRPTSIDKGRLVGSAPRSGRSGTPDERAAGVGRCRAWTSWSSTRRTGIQQERRRDAVKVATSRPTHDVDVIAGNVATSEKTREVPRRRRRGRRQGRHRPRLHLHHARDRRHAASRRSAAVSEAVKGLSSANRRSR